MHNLSLDKRTFFGFSYQDYNEMFQLSSSELELKILDVAGGLNTFFKQRVQQDGKIVSCNDLVAIEENLFDFNKLNTNLDEVKYSFLSEINPKDYLKKSLDNAKLAYDYFKQNKHHHELWVANTLPALPCENDEFDLILCAFYFFTNDYLFDADYQINSILELSRIASEVRIFPLVNHKGEQSANLGKLLLAIQNQPNLSSEISEVDYKLQKNANAMLKIRKISCNI